MPKEYDLTTIIEAALLQAATRAVVEDQVRRAATAAGVDVPDPGAIDAEYAAIVERWVADSDRAPEELHAYHVRLRKHLYQRSYTLNDFKTCLQIAESITKLEKAHAEQVRKAQEAKSFANQFANPNTPALKSIPGGKK